MKIYVLGLNVSKLTVSKPKTTTSNQKECFGEGILTNGAV
jgi:hypothetical protein